MSRSRVRSVALRAGSTVPPRRRARAQRHGAVQARRLRLCDRLSERARLAGAVNAMKFEGERVYAENFDGLGLVNDIRAQSRLPIAGKRILMLGAGGAARGAILPFLQRSRRLSPSPTAPPRRRGRSRAIFRLRRHRRHGLRRPRRRRALRPRRQRHLGQPLGRGAAVPPTCSPAAAWPTRWSTGRA